MKTIPRTLVLAAIFAACACFPSSAPAQAELLKNGDFQQRMANWQLEAPENSEVSVDIPDNEAGGKAAVVLVSAPTKYAYNVKLIQPLYHLPKGSSLELKFSARGDGNASVALRILGGTWDALWNEPLELSPEWKEFTFKIPAHDWPSSMRLDFGDLGGKAGEYWFSNVSLTTAD
jgi:hypothetical protein